MRILFAALAVACTLACPPTCRACTGFAVYSDAPIYGMNFDYDPDIPVRFLIDDSGGTRAFHLAFVKGPRRVPRTAGMNEHGLFVSMQELHPMVPDAGPPGPGEQCTGGLYLQSLEEFESVSDVEEHLAANRVVNCYGITLHMLFADPTGRAMVVEPGDDGHRITELYGDRIVMTNFANCEFVGVDLDSIYGVGADRYRIAHEYLEEHSEGFGVSDAFELLARTAWQWTRCSMVFDPTAGEVYVCLEGDFSRVFRVSIADATMETYRGFDEHRSWHLGRFGVSGAELGGATPGFMDRLVRFFRL